MDYKEKYEQALEKARLVLQERGNEPDGASILYELFPELAESEDEKIRKAIIKMIADIAGGFLFEKHGILKKEALAWLEKQGEPTVIYNKDNYYSAKEKAWNCKNFSNDINNKVIYIEGFKDGYQFGIHEEKPHRWTLHDEAVRKEAISCLLEWKNKFPSIDSIDYRNVMGWLKDELSVHTEEKQDQNNVGISEATKQKLEDNLNKVLEKETAKSLNKFLEKQGEQKPLDIEIPFGAKDSELIEETYHIPDGYHAEINSNTVVIKKGEQKPAMIQWAGDNLQEVIRITGLSPNFHKWFKSWKDYEDYVHTHNNIFKLFNEDGSHYEVPVGAWIIKSPDGYNLASQAKFIPKTVEWSEEDELWLDNAIEACKAMYGETSDTIDWLKSRIPHNSGVTDEELAQAKKDAYNDALGKIEYHSGEPTFDDGWSAAIWYLKKRNGQPQNTWKPSEEQLRELENVFGDRSAGWDDKVVESLYNDLRALLK